MQICTPAAMLRKAPTPTPWLHQQFETTQKDVDIKFNAEITLNTNSTHVNM